jgi:hypothetical protein
MRFIRQTEDTMTYMLCDDGATRVLIDLEWIRLPDFLSADFLAGLSDEQATRLTKEVLKFFGANTREAP